LYFQNTLIRVFYFVFSKYFVGVFYFCNFKILFQSILHITAIIYTRACLEADG